MPWIPYACTVAREHRFRELVFAKKVDLARKKTLITTRVLAIVLNVGFRDWLREIRIMVWLYDLCCTRKHIFAR